MQRIWKMGCIQAGCSICFIICYMCTGNSIAGTGSVNFIATELLGRPTDMSVTVNAIADTYLEIFFEYGTESGVYKGQTELALFPGNEVIEMVMDQLQSDTKYFYRMRYRQIGDSQFRAGKEYSFRTQRSRGTAFKFVIQSDSHIYDKKCTPELYQRTLQNVRVDNPDFLIDLGDTFGDDHDLSIGYDEMLQLHLDQRFFLDNVCHSVPLFLCLGNHEGECGAYLNGTDHNLAIYATKARLRYYPNPFPDEFYSGNTTIEEFVGFPENYYAWEWGDALFVVLDAYRYITTSPKPADHWDWTIGEKQFGWFKKTLENSDATFKFVFAHHVLGQTRGGIRWADKFEWGGHSRNGLWEFNVERPNWAMPIHQLMVENNVSIFFQGHDHLFAREELDGVVYQEVPMPSDATYDVGSENEKYYPTAVVRKNSGHLRVTVSDSTVVVDYVRAFLPQDETSENRNGEIAYSYTIDAVKTGMTTDESVSMIPNYHTLYQNFPNPFNPSTQIAFYLPEVQHVTLTIYNLNAQIIRSIVDDCLNAGNHSFLWDSLDNNGVKVCSGVYFYELKTDEFSQIRKALLLQ